MACPVAMMRLGQGKQVETMATRKGWIAAVALIAILVLVLGGYKYVQHLSSQAALASAPEPVESVAMTSARVAPFAEEARSIGTIVATRTVELRNELAGTVTYVGFRSGEIVPQGAVLLRLDTSEERARFAAQTARAAVAAKNLERSRELISRGFISRAQVDLLTSESRAASAEAQAIKASIAKREIRAPFTARAGIHDVHAGQYLEEGTRITTLQGIDARRYVDFGLPAQTAAELGPGARVKVTGTGLSQDGVEAIVIARDSSASDTRLVQFRAAIDAAPEQLLPGSFAEVFVRARAQQPTVFVPRTAVSQRPHASYVFLMAPAGKGQYRAKQTVVKLGQAVENDVAVLSGLKGGERIVANGAFKLRDGALVRPVSSQAPAR
jgi:membrane fusion protein (multidrug efflux system)